MATIEETKNDTMEIDEIEDVIPIEKLQELGINATDITKMKSAGLQTVASLFMRTLKDLTAIKGLSEAKVQKIMAAAAKLQNFGFRTGLEVSQHRERVFNISTGAQTLDELLGGRGIESMSITEAFGEFRTGKTQLCHTLSVTSQLPHENGGGNGKVIFIDTEGTFRPDRIKAIATRFGVDPEACLDNILVARCYTHEAQIELIAQASALMMEDQFSLIIVDSVTALFRADFTGRGQLSERQQKLNLFMSRLTKLADEFNVAAFITNQVTADPGGSAMFMGDIKKPIGGHILAHASTTRLYLRKGRGEQRVCKIYDSPCLPESEAIYSLSNGGVCNPSD